MTLFRLKPSLPRTLGSFPDDRELPWEAMKFQALTSSLYKWEDPIHRPLLRGDYLPFHLPAPRYKEPSEGEFVFLLPLSRIERPFQIRP